MTPQASPPKEDLDAMVLDTLREGLGQDDTEEQLDEWLEEDTRTDIVAPTTATPAVKEAIVINDRYTLGRLLGEGGTSTVYHTFDSYLEEDVAIKLIKPAFVSKSTTFDHLDEVKLARRVTDKNVVRLFEYGKVTKIAGTLEGDEAFGFGTPFFIMEYLDSGSLYERLTPRGIELGKGLEIATTVATGLASLHEYGIVHRDIKPENILFNRSGEPKIADFGIAQLFADTGKSDKITGTPAYMSPEQITASPLDERSDIFSFGLLLYEMFTGRLPFDDEMDKALASILSLAEFPPARRINPKLPMELNATLRGMLRKHPEERITTMDEVVRRLEAIKKASKRSTLVR